MVPLCEAVLKEKKLGAFFHIGKHHKNSFECQERHLYSVELGFYLEPLCWGGLIDYAIKSIVGYYKSYHKPHQQCCKLNQEKNLELNVENMHLSALWGHCIDPCMSWNLN